MNIFEKGEAKARSSFKCKILSQISTNRYEIRGIGPQLKGLTNAKKKVCKKIEYDSRIENCIKNTLKIAEKEKLVEQEDEHKKHSDLDAQRTQGG